MPSQMKKNIKELKVNWGLEVSSSIVAMWYHKANVDKIQGLGVTYLTSNEKRATTKPRPRIIILAVQ